MTAHTFTVKAAPGRIRLDVFLAAELAPEYSRSRVARIIRAGGVSVNDAAAADPAHPLRPGDRVAVAPAPAIETLPIAAASLEIPALTILYTDDEVIVVDKPAGMVVHAAPGSSGPTLVDALLQQFPELAAMAEPDGVLRPGIVHRLDKQTSGVMVVARTPYARMSLSRQFKDRTVRKVYLAAVRGIVKRDEFEVSRPLGRHPTERKRMSTHSRSPRDALTRFSVLRRFEPAGAGGLASTLVRAIPATGRTHQIRVHLASVGHPCLGDPLYGRAAEAGAGPFDRQALHALGLEFAHPRSAARLRLTALPPADFVAYLTAREAPPDSRVIADWLGRAG
ncbi:MAG TPA: RluA family pseudouridine synthase [Candidatus Binataceae bacterium]|nr:RluA family pseudouridine synthase [Candidatus Binataceae bacterium]